MWNVRDRQQTLRRASDICLCQFWEVIHNLSHRHASSKPAKNIVNRNSHPTNTGFSPIWLDGNDVAIAHNTKRIVTPMILA